MSDLIERLRNRADFEDRDVLHRVMADGFKPERYTGSVTGGLLNEAADALEAAREDADAVKRVLEVVEEFEGCTGAGYRYMATTP